MKVKLGYPDAETPEEYFRVWKTSHEVLRTGHAMIRKELNSHKEEQEKDRKRDKEVIFRAFRRILHDGLDWEFVAVGWLALGVFLRLLASWV